VQASSYVRAGQYSSPLPVVAGFLLRSREAQAERARRKSEENEQLRRMVQQLQRILEQANEQLAEQRLQIAQRKIEIQRLRQQPPVLPDDPALPNHEFGPKMISVCVNLAMNVGLRASINCLEIIRDWLGIPIRLPVWTTVRTWLMRLGVATLEAPVEQADDWIWMADHSNQIGQAKALAVIGIRASRMPPMGVANRHEDVRLLMLEPGVRWKTEDMSAAYERLAEKAGHPLAVLTDGARELRDSVQTLQKQRKDTLLLSDFKHFAANVLKKVVGRDERFGEFTSQTGRTRSAIQQTELAHLTPVSPRPKSRFMNLSVTFVNEQGLFRGAADQLAPLLTSLKLCEASRTVADRLREFLRDHELKLTDDQRLPMSTEILESCFGLFKPLERQHSKGGFTSLLAAFGALLKPATADSVREAFARVSVTHMRTWVRENLGTTVTSQRQTTYAEFKSAA